MHELKHISTALIREFLYTRKEQRLWSARTFRNNRQYLKTFFNYCEIHNLIQDNPVSSIEKPKAPRVLPRYLTVEQVKTILFNTEFFPWRYRIEKKWNPSLHSNLTLGYSFHVGEASFRLQVALTRDHFPGGR